MAAVFLARLFVVGGEARFLDGDRAYFDRHAACGDAVFDGTGCAKMGWAAANLYRITGDSMYRDVVRRAAGELVRLQRVDGDWLASRADGGAQLRRHCRTRLSPGPVRA